MQQLKPESRKRKILVRYVNNIFKILAQNDTTGKND